METRMNVLFRARETRWRFFSFSALDFARSLRAFPAILAEYL